MKNSFNLANFILMMITIFFYSEDYTAVKSEIFAASETLAKM